MPTAKHRIAAYLPLDVDEKFQVFKQERGVGDSQALVLILTEFLEVSQEVSRSSSLDIEALRCELLGELKSELDIRLGELKSELLSKLPKDKSNDDSPVSQKVSHKIIVGEAAYLEQRSTIAQLSTRFGCDSSLVRKQKSKYKDELEKFVVWSKSRDPDGYGWRFDEVDKLFDRV
jgi:hypothetical protein